MTEEQMDCVVHRAQDHVSIGWPPPPPLGSMSMYLFLRCGRSDFYNTLL